LVVLALASVLLWGFDGPRWPLLVVLVGEAILAQRLRNNVEQILHGTEGGLQDLRLLRRLLARIEGSNFRSPRLQALQQRLASGRLISSAAIARLVTIGDAIESRDNLILRVLNLPLLYSVQVAFWAERWRHSYGGQVRVWLEAVGELEALISLSTYSFEHPDDPFPELVAGPAAWSAEELGHPLIPAKKCVRNSLELNQGTRVLLVSGSNMSGKSTLLRTIGINTVLAMAGAPVRAKRLRLTPLEIGASISNHDSLQQGSSRFYAEITRLRAIVARAEANPPLLFLLDELLQGTNSKDRRIGAQALVRALIARGAIGLVSTHDLALTDIGEPGENWLVNVHFEDHLENGRMRFDYRLREGVVSKSNGLELMRSIGLEV
jgi:DNA mismatch repair ATPase MutS